MTRLSILGANLVEELLSRGHDVVVVARRSSADKRPALKRHIEGLGAEVVLAPRIDRRVMEGLGADVYYHVAGTVSGSLEAQRVPHVRLLAELIDAAETLGSRVVYVSSIGAIGTVRGAGEGAVVSEEETHLDPRGHVHDSNHEVSKAEGERLLVSSSPRLGGRWSIVRPGLVFGPWGYHVEWRVSYRLASIGVSVDSSRGLPHIYSVDLARILARAGEGFFDGRWVNAVDPLHPRLSAITGLMCKELGRGCVRVNAWPLLSLLGRLAPRSSPLRVAYSIMRRGYRYSSRHLSGHPWTPLEEQVRAFTRWARGYWG
jgi:nucleoside-diphosphate-sugar epimerase